jgi:lipopolysaccharide export system protein LptA
MRRCALALLCSLPVLELALAAAGFAPAVAVAEKADKDKPVAWSGSRLTGRRTEGGVDIVELEGKVIVTQGTRTIQADRAVIRHHADGSMSATAFGNPVSFREKRDGVAEYVEAYALRAEYDGQKKLLELFDRALLKRESDEVRASYISYNTETETFRAEGQKPADGKADPGSDGRVRGVFQPKSRDASDGKDSREPKPALQPSKTARPPGG